MKPIVIAMDNSPLRLALARHNAIIYGVEDRIEFVLGDYISFAENYQFRASSTTSESKSPIDVVFLSPPWGGPSYLSQSPIKELLRSPLDSASAPTTSQHRYTLDMLSPLPGAELMSLTRSISHNIAFFLPRNTDLSQVSSLVLSAEEIVEVEEAWMGNKLKAITCYFGGLAVGQERLFEV